MNLLIYFALPLATVLLAIVLENLLDSPILVAITFFAIYLIVAFALSAAGVLDLEIGIVLAIVYTIIAFITALLVRYFCNNNIDIGSICTNNNDSTSCGCNRNTNEELENKNSQINSSINLESWPNNKNYNMGRYYNRRRM